MTVSVIGIGMEGRRTLTQEGAQAIAGATLLIGAARMLEPFGAPEKTLLCEYDPQKIAQTLRASDAASAAVLLSGDTGFFSGAKKLLPLLDGMEVRCIPGISSAAYFCAKLGLSYEEMHFVSLHGRESAVALPVKQHAHCFFLLGGEITAAQVCRRLCSFGLSGVTVHIGEELGYDGEWIISGTAAQLQTHTGGKLAVLVTENPGCLRYLPSGIPDSAFRRDKIPMTKSVVRSAAVASLRIGETDVCWDIGCGSGSVAVEMAYRCARGRVYAFDKNPLAVALTRENAAAFGCDNILAAEGVCPDCLEAIPAPDAVFIGGSSGHLCELLDLIRTRSAAARIAVTAVSLETLHTASAYFAEHGAACEITQIAVTQTNRIGQHTMLQALNPVFLIRGDFA